VRAEIVHDDDVARLEHGHEATDTRMEARQMGLRLLLEARLFDRHFPRTPSRSA
jgi:hypothetical protein